MRFERKLTSERRYAMEKIPVPMAEYYALYGQELSQAGSQDICEVERLMNEFEAHESQEARFVQRYKEIAEKTKNPLIKSLLQLIISDEEKHRAITHAMVSTLKGDLTWTKQEGALRGLYELREEKEELLDLTEQFIQVEKEGIKEYKDLIKESKGYYRDLFVLLFQSMIRDSEKHVEILEFLRERLKES
jgi:rubrerythrin